MRRFLMWLLHRRPAKKKEKEPPSFELLKRKEKEDRMLDEIDEYLRAARHHLEHAPERRKGP